jgi:hypothetical protein
MFRGEKNIEGYPSLGENNIFLRHRWIDSVCMYILPGCSYSLHLHILIDVLTNDLLARDTKFVINDCKNIG